MKKRGKGIAMAFYPTGMGGGGDFTNAVVKIKPDGTADLIIGSVELGQGVSTVLPQMVAEVLGIEYEQVKFINDNTDACPICFGSFASRVTYFAGNAAVEAATNARQKLFEIAAPDLDAPPELLEAVDGMIRVKGRPEKSLPIGQVAMKGLYELHEFVVGTGTFGRPRSIPDPETGACNPLVTMAWAATQIEVEVDTETGVVKILDSKSVYDVGKAINPELVKGQVEGGAIMGMSWAILENLYPDYPSPKFQPRSLGEYMISTAMDIPEIETVIVECPSPEGPWGAKGIGEMTANPPAPAVVNAVHDAIGVWITDIPITPEKVLRALEKKKGAERNGA
ncbi:MAG: xanthine dehydrogenase family protein molybdopterin-binding subunit [Deltaproteobacteria bacterium]|nr:MAG: xanthine dehydrogenase family protein molybdopterin-binding subunit [Deltaproteobacteria bacterium]